MAVVIKESHHYQGNFYSNQSESCHQIDDVLKQMDFLFIFTLHASSILWTN